MALQAQVRGQQNGGWNGQENGGGGAGGRKLRADGSINVRTENAKAGPGSSYEGISPDSVCGAQTVANGLASPARRAASGVSEWGAASDGTAVNSRDQLLSHQRATSSQHSAGSPHAQVGPLTPCSFAALLLGDTWLLVLTLAFLCAAVPHAACKLHSWWPSQSVVFDLALKYRA